MSYKISGTLSEEARIIVIDEATWTIDANETITGESYEITLDDGGSKTIIGRTTNGYSVAYGNISPEQVGVPIGDRGLNTGPYAGGRHPYIEYTTISTGGNSTIFATLPISSAEHGGSMVSNAGYNTGLVMGSSDTNYSNTIFTIDILTTGNVDMFGGLRESRVGSANTSNGYLNRGIIAGGGGYNDIIEYVPINVQGASSISFGSLPIGDSSVKGLSNRENNRAVFGGGRPAPGNIGLTDLMSYITITTLGDAVEFGRLVRGNSRGFGAVNNGTYNRGVWTGGTDSGGYTTDMEYITITSLGDSVFFGDRTVAKGFVTSYDNGTNQRGVTGGGYSRTDVMDYITINSTGNATSYGTLINGGGWYYPIGTSNA